MTEPTPLAPEPKSRWRPFYFALGWAFFGLGAAGAFLPILPTTPFMLLSLWAFSKSSARFHAWLYHHRLFGPTLQRWKRSRVISLRVKLIALASMAASLAYVALVRRPPWYATLAMALVIATGVAYIFRFPSRER